MRFATARPQETPYAELYADVLRRERMCLWRLLGAEYETLPQPMRDSVAVSF